MYLTKEHKHTRDKLEEFIGDYNQAYNTKFTTKDSQSFYNYYNDIARKVKSREIDILLVVNMFLTGFDSKTLSTLYVDKNLKYHGLIQAFSRTNRILNEQKSQGNIVCFRNLKKATDDAIALFSNKQAKEEIIIAPYEDYVGKFNEAFDNLQKLTPKPDDVNQLADEEEELKYIQAFRELMRLKNVLTTFTDFEWADLEMDEQNFENFKGKYLDLYEKVKTDRQKEKVSVLNDVDFELDLIHRDEVNVAYILKLLAKLKEAKAEEKEQHKKQIIEAIAGEAKLRSKRELIGKFIEENLPAIKDIDEIPEAFEKFWNAEEKKAIDAICEQERLDPDKFRNVLEEYIFTQREPLRDEVLETLQGKKPGIRERKTVAKAIIGRISDFVETFMSGMEG
jgi:type I restriction enzyme R subunit